MFILIKCIVYDEINQYQFDHLVLQSLLTGLLNKPRISKWNSYLHLKELSLILSEWWFSDTPCKSSKSDGSRSSRVVHANATIITKRRTRSEPRMNTTVSGTDDPGQLQVSQIAASSPAKYDDCPVTTSNQRITYNTAQLHENNTQNYGTFTGVYRLDLKLPSSLSRCNYWKFDFGVLYTE